MTIRLCIVIVILLIGAPAQAHISVTGWAYSTMCCSDQDCHHAEPGDVLAEASGYRITNTGELIPYNSPKLKLSRDVMYHICQAPLYKGGELFTRCLYVPAMF